MLPNCILKCKLIALVRHSLKSPIDTIGAKESIVMPALHLLRESAELYVFSVKRVYPLHPAAWGGNVNFSFGGNLNSIPSHYKA